MVKVKSNANADTLSWNPVCICEASVGAVSGTEECNDQEDMIQCQEQD